MSNFKNAFFTSDEFKQEEEDEAIEDFSGYSHKAKNRKRKDRNRLGVNNDEDSSEDSSDDSNSPATVKKVSY